MEKILRQLPDVLLDWYQQNKRDLPWRQDKEPYHVWLSEIMLQQTRVEAVRGYYTRFLKELPSVEALANCDDDGLYKLWEGLGYYNRVRNLKKAAGVVVSKYNGIFPRDYTQILALPGVGEYTAGAICSICFDLPTPAVDGNVMRVISRLLDDDTPIDLPACRKRVRNLLAANYPREAGAFTQALMELGATICGPDRQPDCESCPCKAFCLGLAHGTAPRLPVKSPKKTRRQEDKTVLILHCQGTYAVRKRPHEGLLGGLWQFPDLPGLLSLEQALTQVRAMGMEPSNILRQSDKTHMFTHVQWNMRGYYIEVCTRSGDLVWASPEEVDGKYALPTAYRQFWNAGTI